MDACVDRGVLGVIYMLPLDRPVHDSDSRCSKLCVRKPRNTFPYRHRALLPNSNKSGCGACIAGRDRPAMRTPRPAANNCLSMLFEPQ